MASNSLKALAESKTDGISKVTTFRIDPTLVQFEEGFNLREENPELTDHINRIEKAMEAGAFVPPIDVTVADGVVTVRDGHCRTRAALKVRKLNPEFTLECRQLRGNDAEAVLHMLGTGSGQKPLTPLEQGKGYLRLIRMGMKPTEIASKLGVSRVTIDNGLTLAEAPAEVQQMVANGEVSSTTARDAIKQGAEGVKALTKAVKEHRKEPKTKANGKTAKVTNKTLRGTKADKATKTLRPEETAPVVVSNTSDAPVADPSLIAVTLNREAAEHSIKFLRDFGGDDAKLHEVATALETALL